MNMNDVEFTLMMITLSTISLAVLIYVGNWLLYTLKTPDTPIALQLAPVRSRVIISNNEIARRRSEVKPGIICSLPIHQVGREGSGY